MNSTDACPNKHSAWRRASGGEGEVDVTSVSQLANAFGRMGAVAIARASAPVTARGRSSLQGAGKARLYASAYKFDGCTRCKGGVRS